MCHRPQGRSELTTKDSPSGPSTQRSFGHGGFLLLCPSPGVWSDGTESETYARTFPGTSVEPCSDGVVSAP